MKLNLVEVSLNIQVKCVSSVFKGETGKHVGTGLYKNLVFVGRMSE